ncbi:hypothetical protein, partial [Mesorhizobium sp.]|uniref:hypothetical protein n=1 Tax=Mesorhizobium sp. TaxID=1871066 RepID=UPI0025BBB26F
AWFRRSPIRKAADADQVAINVGRIDRRGCACAGLCGRRCHHQFQTDRADGGDTIIGGQLAAAAALLLENM